MFYVFFMFVDNDNTIISITHVVIRHALLVVDGGDGDVDDSLHLLGLDSTLSLVVFTQTADTSQTRQLFDGEDMITADKILRLSTFMKNIFSFSNCVYN
jgi:hypothetical protein